MTPSSTKVGNWIPLLNCDAGIAGQYNQDHQVPTQMVGPRREGPHHGSHSGGVHILSQDEQLHDLDSHSSSTETMGDNNKVDLIFVSTRKWYLRIVHKIEEGKNEGGKNACSKRWAAELAKSRQQGKASKVKRTGTVIEVAEADVRQSGRDPGLKIACGPDLRLATSWDVRFAPHWRILTVSYTNSAERQFPRGLRGLGADAMRIGWSPCSCSRAHAAHPTPQSLPNSPFPMYGVRSRVHGYGETRSTTCKCVSICTTGDTELQN